MAFAQQGTCSVCGETYTYNGANPRAYTMVCPDCQHKKEQAEEEAFLSELKKLTVQERLERLEKIIYNSRGGTVRSLLEELY